MHLLPLIRSRSFPFGLSVTILCLVTFAFTTVSPASAQRSRDSRPAPTQADIAYGPDERHRLDLWIAESNEPTPLVVYIHGGGFRGGRKEGISGRTVRELLDAGISVASVEYRLLSDARLPAAHHDCRRAIQFLRSSADRWNIDTQRVGAFGGSAGAQLCMWLAFHDDMAEPDSRDALRRQSTRLACVATTGGQTTMDFQWWMENIPGYSKPHRPPSDYFGDVSQTRRDAIIQDISALSLISSDDPPIWMSYRMAPDDPIPADQRSVQGWQVHHVNFGIALEKAAEALGVESHVMYPGAEGDYQTLVAFFKAKLLDSK